MGGAGGFENVFATSIQATVAMARPRYRLPVRDGEVVLGERTWVMGILNATPDSFSDGGCFASADAAVAHGVSLFEAGADIVDVGGESTRPGGGRVDPDEERRRVAPVIEGLRRRAPGLVSVDTNRAEVARAALDAGADIVNDVSGFRFDPEMARLVAERRVPAVLMHLRGGFETMHEPVRYRDVAEEVVRELAETARAAERAGVARSSLLLDPGLGFSKDVEQTLAMLRHLPELARLERPILVGPSRKSFLGRVLGLPSGERLLGTAAAVAACALAGAHVVRVHDVAEMVQVVRVCDAIRGDAPQPPAEAMR
jgi:dihydropteroate synthase